MTNELNNQMKEWLYDIFIEYAKKEKLGEIKENDVCPYYDPLVYTDSNGNQHDIPIDLQTSVAEDIMKLQYGDDVIGENSTEHDEIEVAKKTGKMSKTVFLLVVLIGLLIFIWFVLRTW